MTVWNLRVDHHDSRVHRSQRDGDRGLRSQGEDGMRVNKGFLNKVEVSAAEKIKTDED